MAPIGIERQTLCNPAAGTGSPMNASTLREKRIADESTLVPHFNPPAAHRLRAGGQHRARARLSRDGTGEGGVPDPGTMTVGGVPAQVRPGHTFTLHEDLPLAVFNGQFALESESTPGVWQTLISAPPRPREVWLHWKVPMALRGTQLTVRYVLLSGGQMLAVSPTSTIEVSS